MTRGTGTNSRAVKKPSRKAATLRRAPKTASSSAQSTPSIDEPQEQIDRLRRERDEALEQLAATSKVLEMISSSTEDLRAIFESILINATRICGASFANLALIEGDELKAAAIHGAPAAFEEAVRRNPVVPRQSPVGQVIETRQPVHIADIQTNA